MRAFSGFALLGLTWTLRACGELAYYLGLASVVIGLSANRRRIVLYHACETDESSFIRGLNVNVDPVVFEMHLAYYRKYYNIASLDSINDENTKSLLITFDDGYASVHKNAFPRLQRFGCPAVVYLIGNAIDNRELVWVNEINWALNQHPGITRRILERYDRLKSLDSSAEILQAIIRNFTPCEIDDALNHLRQHIEFDPHSDLYLTSEQIDEMKRGGISFGFHTKRHSNLANCSDDELNSELDSFDLKILQDCTTFAYPFGFFNENAVRAVSARDYDAVMTVGIGNSNVAARHLDRVEVFASRPSSLFAELEVVEPTLAFLRQLARKALGPRKAKA